MDKIEKYTNEIWPRIIINFYKVGIKKLIEDYIKKVQKPISSLNYKMKDIGVNFS